MYVPSGILVGSTLQALKSRQIIGLPRVKIFFLTMIKIIEYARLQNNFAFSSSSPSTLSNKLKLGFFYSFQNPEEFHPK